MSLNSKDFDFVMNRFFMASVDFVKDNVPPGWYEVEIVAARSTGDFLERSTLEVIYRLLDSTYAGSYIANDFVMHNPKKPNKKCRYLEQFKEVLDVQPDDVRFFETIIGKQLLIRFKKDPNEWIANYAKTDCKTAFFEILSREIEEEEFYASIK